MHVTSGSFVFLISTFLGVTLTEASFSSSPALFVTTSSSKSSHSSPLFSLSRNKQRLTPFISNCDPKISWQSTLSTSSPSLLLLHSSSQSDEENNVDEQSPSPRIKQYFATCIPGLETILADELLSLGASNVQPSGKSGVYFTSSPDDEVDLGLKVVLWLRTAHRVMELICSTDPSLADFGIMMLPPPSSFDDDDVNTFDDFDSAYYHEPIQSKQDLYNFIKNSVPFKEILGDGKGNLLTLSIDKIIMNGYTPKELRHSHYTSLTVKNAIVDGVRDLRDDGIRPDVDIKDADVPFVVVLKGYKKDVYSDKDDGVVDVSLYRCLHAGGSLHRRGYRRSQGGEDGDAVIHKAALKESLAAALLYETGWHKLIHAARYDDYQPAVFVDPMTGSATMPIEAALIACDIAPGLMRIRCSSSSSRGDQEVPPIVRWKDGPTMQEWKTLLQDAAKRAKAGILWASSINQSDDEDESTTVQRTNLIIVANERHPNAFSLAQSSVNMAGLGSIIKLSQGDCIDFDLGGGSQDDEEETTTSLSQRVVIPGRTIVGTNPPWGKRLDDMDVEDSWASLKTFLQRECNDAEAWILSGNKLLTRILRMKKTRSFVVKTAGEDLRWIQYHIFPKKKREDNEREEGVVNGGRFEEKRIRGERNDYSDDNTDFDSNKRRMRGGANRSEPQQGQQKRRMRAGGNQVSKRKRQIVPEKGRGGSSSGGGPWY